MADIAIFRINYKSDFILTLNSDAGWMTPFCIKFWTGAPIQAYFVGFDGTTYTNCAPVDGEPTKLRVQFDDHHLPIGDLKFQIGYHFTVSDFPTSVEDEVLNQASVIIEVDGAPAQVMLDFNGETAPEIEFSLPAYANEAQRIANEEQRIAAEQQRIANEDARIQDEEIRQQNEQQRIDHETARINEFATLKSQSQAATRDANDAATLANQKAQLAADKAALADGAATLAIQKAQLAADKAALANDAAQLAADKAALAQQKAEYAQQQGSYAKDQGDYAKNQGNYAKEQGDTALADHQRAEADHGIAVDDHTQAGNDHTRAESDHSIAVDDHTQAGNDHTRAESDHGIAVDDHTQAGNDHTRAESDHGIAVDDHTQAGNDHTRAESDHNRAESDHAAVEVFVDSLGAFDISAYHATGGVLAKYADLTAALGTNGANIPEALRKGGMSVKFVQSSDNKYVQFRYMLKYENTTAGNSAFINTGNWQGVDDEPIAGSQNLVTSGSIAGKLYGDKVSRTFSATAGTNLNTTSWPVNLNVPAGKKVVIQLSSDIEGLLYKRVNVFFVMINNSWVSQSISPIFGALNEYVFNSNVTAFGFLLYGSEIPANGHITISAELESEIGINKQLQILKEGVQKLEESVESKADKEQNYNLFNPNSPDIVSGSYINGSAEITSNSNYIITQPFALAPGESITSNKLGSGTSATLFKSASDLNSGIKVFVKIGTPCTLTNITNTTLYARFSLDVNNTKVIINKGTVSLPYVPYYASNPPKVLYEGNLNIITQELGNDTEKVISQAKMTDLLGLDFGGDKVRKSFNTIAGTTLNTTSYPTLFTIKKNEIFYCKLVGDSSNQNAKTSVFYYRVNGSWVNANNRVPALLQGKVYALTVPSDADAVGVFSGGSEHETGTLQLVLWHNISIPDLVKRNNIKSCTLKDIVKNWMNGEKSPIAFIGDSTTDGTSTTGWTVTDSHPGKDAQNWLLNTSEGQDFETDKTWQERVYDAHMLGKGRGTVDYVWQKAYPYLLEQLIQKELGNNNARVYNIGYYGNTLRSFESVPVYFGDVYSDTKMAGIVLGINDRDSNTPGEFYVKLLWQLETYVLRIFEQGIIPFMVTNQFVTQSNATGTGNYSIMFADNIQALTNRAKIEVARKYNLEVIDMNSFDQLVLRASSYLYNNLTENLHFKDLGHVLEAGFLFTQLIPWINYVEDADELYVGFNGVFNRSELNIGAHFTVVQDKFKRQVNYTKGDSSDKCIFDAYIFNDSHNGVYTVKYLTPVASGYIVIDGDTANPIAINSTEMTLDPWDIGLHHVQVYTGESTTVAFKGFLLEQN